MTGSLQGGWCRSPQPQPQRRTCECRWNNKDARLWIPVHPTRLKPAVGCAANTRRVNWLAAIHGACTARLQNSTQVRHENCVVLKHYVYRREEKRYFNLTQTSIRRSVTHAVDISVIQHQFAPNGLLDNFNHDNRHISTTNDRCSTVNQKR